MLGMRLILLAIVAAVLGTISCVQESIGRPNIVYVILDDVGFRDLGRHVSDSPIPTPFIDTLTARGVHLAQHYVHSVCSPSRAALMTGRYHANTGLTNVLIPGTPAGLPSDIPTLPALLSELGGYSTAMAGKWHLGHAQHKMTPIGRGFEYFTGMYMWDVDSYTKQMYEMPWEAPLLIDWVREERVSADHRNATTAVNDLDGRSYSYVYEHFAEPRHATEAITHTAEDFMRRHAQRNSNRNNNAEQSGASAAPMFLYVAYTAAHSPLQPLPRHAAACTHLSHTRRRDYCGMVVGLDEALRNLTATIEAQLGSNTIMVVASDNGGSAYFGGMNQPLRGHKGTPFEGGVRVPAFIVDFTPEQRYLLGPQPDSPDTRPDTHPDSSNADPDSSGADPSASGESGVALDSTLTSHRPMPRKPVDAHYSRVFHGMMHISDWLPTLLSYAGIPASEQPKRLDGMDFSKALRLAEYEDAVSTAEICRGDQGNRQSVAVSPRAGLLVEMYSSEESVFNQSLAAYRLGDYKLIRGTVRDDNYYFESTNNKINCSHVSIGSQLIETVIDLFDNVFGKGQSDTVNIIMVHMWLHDLITFTDMLFPRSTKYLQTTAAEIAAHESTDLRLYNIALDPCERVNLAGDFQYSAIIAAINAELDTIAANRPPSLPIDLQLDISLGAQWSKHHVAGDCSANAAIKPAHCRFTHSWVADDADPLGQTGLMKAQDYINYRTFKLIRQLATTALAVVSMTFVMRYAVKSLFF